MTPSIKSSMLPTSSGPRSPKPPPPLAAGLALQGQPGAIVDDYGLAGVGRLSEGLLYALDGQQIDSSHRTTPLSDLPDWAVVRIVVRQLCGRKRPQAVPNEQKRRLSA